MKMYYSLLFVLLIALAGCLAKQKQSRNDLVAPVNKKPYTKTQIDSVIVSKYKRFKDSTEEALSTTLFKQFGESDISKSKYEVYRFFFWRAFCTPGGTLFSLVDSNGTYHMTITLYWGPTHAPDGSVRIYEGHTGKDSIKRISFIISEKDWKAFKTILNRANFWTLSSTDPDRPGGNDGCVYALEGSRISPTNRDKIEHHIVWRWSPFDGSFTNACQKLIEISGYTLKKDGLYLKGKKVY